jgi:23S rRNA (pseudouridine1915-N3)-methyltransferase
MKFQIITVGKKHDKNLENYISDFEKRIKTHFALEWTILSSLDDNSKEVQIKKESEKIINILEKAGNSSFVILLDENGKEKSTAELANLFEEKMNIGVEKIIFIIGGAFGVSSEVKEKVDLILSLSKLIFPHQLVRVILVEQIYRSISILKGSKYHHE